MQNELENYFADNNSTDTSEHCAAPQSTRSEQVQVRSFDIGLVDFSKILTDNDKYNILTEKCVPIKSWKCPLRLTGKTKRRIPNSVFYTSRSTLSHSLIKDGVLCATCCVFAKSLELFVRELHSDWSNVDRHIDRHVKCKTHLFAAEAVDEFLKICEQKCSSVKQRLSQAYHDQVEGTDRL